jgi:hypothetical protein
VLTEAAVKRWLFEIFAFLEGIIDPRLAVIAAGIFIVNDASAENADLSFVDRVTKPSFGLSVVSVYHPGLMIK